MIEKLLEYLYRQEGETLGALSGNSNGVLEISIGLKKDRPEDDGNDAGYAIRYSKLVIMLNRWELKNRGGEILASNETTYPKVEKILMELGPEKITKVEMLDTENLVIGTDGYMINSSRSAEFEMLIHDFDHNITFAVGNKGEITITSKNKDISWI